MAIYQQSQKVLASILFGTVLVLSAYAGTAAEGRYYLGIGASNISGDSGNLDVSQLTSLVGLFGVRLYGDIDAEFRTTIDQPDNDGLELDRAYSAHVVLNRDLSPNFAFNVRSGFSKVKLTNQNGALDADEGLSYGAGFRYKLDGANFVSFDYIRLLDEEISGSSQRLNQFSVSVSQIF